MNALNTYNLLNQSLAPDQAGTPGSAPVATPGQDGADLESFLQHLNELLAALR